MKDVTNNTLTEINVDFTPAKIDVDYEAIEKQLNAIVAQYTDYEVTASTYKTDYKERTRLNKLKQAFEARKKEILEVIDEPKKEFTKKCNKIVEPLDEVIKSITLGLNAVDEQERLLRVDVVRAVFEEKCVLAGLEKTTFETSYNDYTAKTKYFKAGKFELKQSTIDEIDNMVLAEFKAVEEFKASKETIEEHAKEYGLLPEMYIRALEDGKTLVDVLKVMKIDKDAAILRKEQEEARAKAEAERKAEIERMAQENANAQIKAYNAETGEVLESDVIIPETQNEAENGAKFENKPLVYDLRLIFPNGNKQAKMFKDFLDMNGIKYQELKEEVKK